MEQLLQIIDLSKLYNKKPIVNKINLNITKGSFNLLVGNNGSGKTTLLKIIAKLIKPTSGKIIFDKNLRIGFQPEKLTYKIEITVKRLLSYLSGFNKDYLNNKNEFLIKNLNEFALTYYKNNKVSELSHGYQKRILILQALLDNADLYLFDEPMDGLDEEFKVKFINIIKSLKEQSKTIILITHDLEPFKDIADNLIYFSNGRVAGKLDIANLNLFNNNHSDLIFDGINDEFRSKNDILISDNKYLVKIENKNKLFLIIKKMLENKIAISEILLREDKWLIYILMSLDLI